MELIHRIRHAIANLFRRGRMDAEMKEELAYHREMIIERNVAAGMTRREAEGAAFREFGGADQ